MNSIKGIDRTFSRFRTTIVDRKPCLAVISLFMAVSFLSGCSGTRELASGWTGSEITIDGKSGDWIGATTFDKDQDLSIGVRNDEEFAYVCFITSNRMTQRQIMVNGLTVWFDPTGKKEKTFGILFPVSTIREARRMMGEGERPEPGTQRNFVDRVHTELEIVGADPNNRLRLSFAELKGIELRMNTTGSSLVYEMKIPLKPGVNHPYAIGMAGMGPLAIGFETEIITPERIQRGDMPKGAGAAGIRGTARGNRPAGARPEAGMQGERPAPLDFWARVQLAKKSE